VGAQSSCTALTSLQNSANTLFACFENTRYAYDPTTCSLQTNLDGFCKSSNCLGLVTDLIRELDQENCTAEFLTQLKAASPAFCNPPSKNCSDGSACIKKNSDTSICVPINANSPTACNATLDGANCAACQLAPAALCAMDLQDSSYKCVAPQYETVDIFEDPLPDVYFFFTEMLCRRNEKGSYCVNTVYKKYGNLMTCDDWRDAGCCAGSYLNLVSDCVNPAMTTLDIVEAWNSTCLDDDEIHWNQDCGGDRTSVECCSATVCLPVNGGFSLSPRSILIILFTIFLNTW